MIKENDVSNLVCFDEDKVNILHVDDDLAFLDTTKQILEMDDKLRVTSVTSVKEAFSLLLKFDFDIIVSDYQMPEKDGLTFLAQLREEDNKIPFILFTGKGREDVAIKALNLGANQYINKIGKPQTVYGELSFYIQELLKRKKIESLLGEHQNRLKKISKQTPGMLYQFKMRSDGSFLVPFSTDGIIDIFGCTPEDVKNDFSPILKVLHDEDVEEVLKSIIESAESLETWSIEFRVKIPGRAVKWLLGSSTPEKLSDGSIVWSGYVVDITAQKEVSEKLRIRNDMLEIVTRNTHSGLSIISKDFDVVYANKVLTDIFGDVIGKKCYSTFGFGNSICPNCGVKEIFETGKKQVIHDRMIQDIDGNDLYLNLVATAIRDSEGKINGATEISVNITDQKIRAQKIERQKNQIENLVESLPEVIFETDLNGKLVYVNSTGFKLFGYSKDDFKKGLNVIDMIAPSDRLKVQDSIKKILQGEAPKFRIYCGQKKDGSIFEVLSKSSKIVHEGKIVGLRGILIDNTQQKALRKRLLLKSKMLDSVADSIITTDPNGKIIYWNNAAENLFGWKVEEVLGKCIFDVTVPKINQKKSMEIMSKLKKGKKWKGEFEVQRKDGTRFVGEVVDSPVVDEKGNLIAIIGSTRDLTEQKVKAEKLKEYNEKFRTLAEQSPNMIFINQGGRVIYANRKCEEVMGYTKAEFYSQDFSFLDLIYEEGKEKVMNAFSKNIQGFENKPLEYSVVTKQGKIIDVRLTTKVISLGGKNAILGTLIDISKSKEYEKKLQNVAKFPAENPNPVLRISYGGTVLYANPAAKKFSCFLDESDNSKPCSSLLKLVSKAIKIKKNLEIELDCGQEVFSYLAVPILEHKYCNVYGRAVTERKKVEHDLKKSIDSLAKHQKLIEAMLVASSEVLENNEFFVSASKIFNVAKKIIGATAGYVALLSEDGHENEVLFLDSGDLKCTVDPNIPMPIRGLRGVAYKTGKPVFENNFNNSSFVSFLPGGHVTLENVLFGPLILEGKAVGLIGLANKPGGFIEEDVEIIEAFSQLAAIALLNSKNLEELVDSNKRVNVINEKLNVVGRISRHDARNKLAIILNRLYLIKMKYCENQELINKLESLEEVVDQISRIFDFASVYEKIGLEELEEIDVGDCVDYASELMDFENVQVINSCEGLIVIADSLLKQLFYNLMHNSVVHGEHVTQIRVYSKVCENGVKLFYEDDGVGIPKDEKELIFKEGYGKGTGFGLFLVRRICSTYGWKIDEQGVPGEGAKFMIEIPKGKIENEL